MVVILVELYFDRRLTLYQILALLAMMLLVLVLLEAL
jgi:hypothetical protein